MFSSGLWRENTVRGVGGARPHTTVLVRKLHRLRYGGSGEEVA